jgi:type I restriction-modification system DNA methylase subunit
MTLATVTGLANRFLEQYSTYKSISYNETQVRREFIDPFFKALGWDIDNTSGALEIYKDVIHEDSLRIEHSLKAPDYCFCHSGKRLFFVEAKKPAVNILESPGPVYQLKRYGWSAELAVSVLTDFEDLVIYDCRIKPSHGDDPRIGRLKSFHYLEYAERWDEIYSLLGKESVSHGSLDKLVSNVKLSKGQSTLDKSFLAELEAWRDQLSKNIFHNNKQIGVRSLNYVVQQAIDRIVFLRICEDRGIEKYGTLLSTTTSSGIYKKLVDLFRKADERYNSGLFCFSRESGREEEVDILSPTLQIDDDSLKPLIQKLYYPDSPYEFSVIPVEILGQVYEQFLGKVITVDPATSKITIELKPELRKAGGVFYTPAFIVIFIVHETLGKFLYGKKPSDIRSYSPKTKSKLSIQERSNLWILDPACGSGSFLLCAFQYLIDWYRKMYLSDGIENHKTRLYIDANGQAQLTTAEKKEILLAHIYGVDIDSQAVEVTKLSLLLKVLEGENSEAVDRQLKLFHERALPSLSANIKCGNSVIESDYYATRQLDLTNSEELIRVNAFDWHQAFPYAMSKGGFNVVIGNPPWISLTGRFRNEIHPESEINYLINKHHGNTTMPNMYEYFISLGHSLVCPNGWFSFIVPDRFAFNDQFVNLRKRILDTCSLECLVFKAPFPGVVADTLIFTLQKKKASKSHNIRISKFGNDVLETSQDSFRTLQGHKFQFFESESESLLISQIDGHPMCKPLSFFCDSTSGFGGKSKLITSSQISNAQIPTLKGDSIGRYILRKQYWFEFTRSNITGRTTDRKKLGSKPKVLIRKTGDSVIATYDDSGIYPEQSLYFLYNSKTRVQFKYILGLLNSSVIDTYFKAKCLTNKDSIAQVKKTDLDNMPIPDVDFSKLEECQRHDRIVELVDQLIDAKSRLKHCLLPQEVNLIERQVERLFSDIDKLAHQCYGLAIE